VAGLAEIEKLRDSREGDPRALAEKVDALALQVRDLTEKKVAADQQEAERKRVLAAQEEAARKAAEALQLEEERKKAEEDRKAKELEDWKGALAAAKQQVEDWAKHAEIAEARNILAGVQPFIKNALALDKAIKGFPADFDPAVPAQDRLRIALKVVTDAGKLVDAPAKAAVASREDDIDDAVASLTEAIETDKKAAGTEPRMDQLRLAAQKIPGLLDEVRQRYRDEHTETPPQLKRREAQLATQEGEIEKYDRIGGWMNALGFGGAPRTGRNGVVFMAQVSNRIGPYKTHISQFAANATIPENKLKSTVEEAMDSLFRIESNYKCPHITLEIGQKGSEDNAHYYMTQRFNGGGIAVEELADYEAKMKAEFDRVMELFRSRLAKILQ